MIIHTHDGLLTHTLHVDQLDGSVWLYSTVEGEDCDGSRATICVPDAVVADVALAMLAARGVEDDRQGSLRV